MKIVFAACVAALLLGACQTKAGDEVQAKVDPRQGEEVKSICFSQQIRNWTSLDNRSIIVLKNRKEAYKLDLIGACDADDAFTTIGLISRFGGGSCLQPGDQLVTDSRTTNGLCQIQRIYAWNPDKKPAADGTTK